MLSEVLTPLRPYDWQATSVTITVGSQVWVEDTDEAWIDGEVVEVKGDEIIVSCTSGKTVSASY